MQSAHFNKKNPAITSVDIAAAAGLVEQGGGSIPVLTTTSDGKPPLPVAENIGLFDPEKLSNAIDHANQITLSYGVTVMSINIISAIPKDMDLMRSLAKGAVAAAEAQQMVYICVFMCCGCNVCV
jgi:hypothetical protein